VEKRLVKKQIYVWTKEFMGKNGREPTKDERESLQKEMFKKYRLVNKALKDLGDDDDEEEGEKAEKSAKKSSKSRKTVRAPKPDAAAAAATREAATTN
jgi:hypothetical protein